MRDESLDDLADRIRELQRQELLSAARDLPTFAALGKELLAGREEGPPLNFFEIMEEDCGMHPLKTAICMLAGCIELSPEEFCYLALCANLAAMESKEDGL